MTRPALATAVLALLAACGPARVLEPSKTSTTGGTTTARSTTSGGASASTTGGSTSGPAFSTTGVVGWPTTGGGTFTASTSTSSGSTTTSTSTSTSSSTSTTSSGGTTSTSTSTSTTSTSTTGGSTTGSSTTTSTSTTGGTTTSTSTSTSTTGSSGTTGASTVPVIGGCALFPPDNPWNQDISQLPLNASSSDWVNAIGASAGLHPDFGTVWNGAPNGIPFVVVPIDQALVPVSFSYASESDPGPYPVPMDAPIEGGPSSTGDRHVLVLQQVSCTLYEMYSSYPDATNGTWSAGSGAIWHLSENERRPDGTTSADAAGLAILPGLVRYDEVASGAIHHALRFTASSVQHAYIYPATHSDGIAGSDPTHPPMGARFRLKASFDITPFPPEVQVILKALKQYGMILADTGGDWSITGAPDSRWSDADLHTLANVPGSDFEVVDTGPVHVY